MASESPSPLPSGGDLVVERRGGIAIIWFNRPARLNPFRGLTFDLLHQALDQLAGGDRVAAAVLTGRGRVFCAGEDLDEAHGAAVDGFLLQMRGASSFGCRI